MMLWTMMAALAAGTSADAEVATGWYLWQTGQADAAYAIADGLPTDLTGSAVPFVVAMAVERGEGPSVEAELRDAWSEAPNDIDRRVALAWAMSLRNKEKGSWCDEVTTLVQPAVEGDARLWATRAGRQQELRCDGKTEHAEAELRRIAKEGGGGEGEAVVGILRAGYYKEGLPQRLEAVWAAEPHLLRNAGYPFQKSAGGPMLPGVKRVTNSALKSAVESDNPMVVHAAMLGYQAAGKEKPAEEARARLLTLDPKADPALSRTMQSVSDPAEVSTMDNCTRTALSLKDGLECIEGVRTADSGAVTAYQQNARRMLLDQLERADDAFSAAKAAYVADPENRYYARLFSDRARARNEELPLAVKAATAVLRDRVPLAAADVKPSLRARRAGALERLAWTELAAGMGDAALGHMILALQLEDTPLRRHGLGQSLAAAGQVDDAALVLVYAASQPLDDTAMMTRSREILRESLGDWHAGGLAGAFEEVTRKPGHKGDHPLVGTSLPEELVGSVEEEPPSAIVVAVWADWLPEAVAALERLDGINKRYVERGVQLLAVDVGLADGVVPEGLTLTNKRGSAATMRALRLVALPSVVVANEEGVVMAVLPGYDAGGLSLEEALDDFLPEEEPVE